MSWIQGFSYKQSLYFWRKGLILWGLGSKCLFFIVSLEECFRKSSVVSCKTSLNELHTNPVRGTTSNNVVFSSPNKPDCDSSPSPSLLGVRDLPAEQQLEKCLSFTYKKGHGPMILIRVMLKSVFSTQIAPCFLHSAVTDSRRFGPWPFLEGRSHSFMFGIDGLTSFTSF